MTSTKVFYTMLLGLMLKCSTNKCACQTWLFFKIPYTFYLNRSVECLYPWPSIERPWISVMYSASPRNYMILCSSIPFFNVVPTMEMSIWILQEICKLFWSSQEKSSWSTIAVKCIHKFIHTSKGHINIIQYQMLVYFKDWLSND